MTDPQETEQRKSPINSCRSASQPVLKVGREEYNVLDYSRNGLRISGGNQYPMSGWVNGILCLAGREPIPIDAIVVRRKDGEVGLHLIAPISV